jgi:peptide/nickel transport system permease protein
MVPGIAVPFGVILGIIAGNGSQIPGNLIMRVAAMLLAFPALILAMAIGAALGADLTHAVLALPTARWPKHTRLIQGQVLSIREATYVLAAVATGASRSRIVSRHALPNCVSSILVLFSLDVGRTILSAAGLSLIGIDA